MVSCLAMFTDDSQPHVDFRIVPSIGGDLYVRGVGQRRKVRDIHWIPVRYDDPKSKHPEPASYGPDGVGIGQWSFSEYGIWSFVELELGNGDLAPGVLLLLDVQEAG
jgi:hypothetical protein